MNMNMDLGHLDVKTDATPQQDSANPAVAAIILAYNDPLVKRAIESVLNQTYKNINLYIVDNASDDGITSAIINEYAYRATIIRNPVNKQGEAISDSFFNALTEPYMSLLFSDDWWHVNRVETGIRANADIVFSNNYIVDSNEQVMEKIPLSHYPYDVTLMTRQQHLRYMFDFGNSLHPVSLFLKTDIYRALGGFPKYLNLIGDLYLFVKLLMSDYNVVFLPDILQSVTIHTDPKGRRNASAENCSHNRKWMYERIPIFEVYCSDIGLSKYETIFDCPSPLTTKAQRLFALGMHAMQRHQEDYSYFGFRCIAKAIEMDYESVNALCIDRYGNSIGEYLRDVYVQYCMFSHTFGPPFLKIFHRDGLMAFARKNLPLSVVNFLLHTRKFIQKKIIKDKQALLTW